MQSWRRCSVEGTSLVFYNASTCAAALDRKYFLWKLLLALKFCSFCTALHTSNIQDQPAHVCKYMRKVRRCGEFVVDGCPQERNHWMNVNYLPSKRRQNIGALLFNGDIYRKKVPHGRPGNGIPYPAVEPASREVWRFEEGLRYR
ncbi:uncharacterized protein LOC144112593 isoform X3 [Amblyomma americanum]